MNSDSVMNKRIKKIVYIMLENRSFDNLLGWLYDGDASPPVNSIGAPAKDGEPTFHGLTDKLLTKYAQPYHFDILPDATEPIVRGVGNAVFPCVTPMLDPFEQFQHVTKQLFGSGPVKPEAPMLGFGQNYLDRTLPLPSVYKQILYTYDFDELPVINTLAKEFGVSDLWFSSIPSQTSINRAYSICGNSVGLPSKNATELCQMVNNHYWDHEFTPAQFTKKTIWEILSDNEFRTDKDWRIYYSDAYLDGFFDHTHSYTYLMFPSLQQTLADKIGSPMNRMYNTIEQFYTDALNGDLPAFTYLEPHYSFDLVGEVGLHGNDYHPPSDVQHGEQLLAKIYQTLVKSGLMDETLLVITFDEHGGTFDHVSPKGKAINPYPDVKGEMSFGFDRYGVRVPTIFVSPWVAKNTVIRSADPTIPFDHTSWLATLLTWFGLEPSLLGGRTAKAPLFDAIIGDTPRSCPTLPEPWECKKDKSELRNDPLSIDLAANVARIVAGKKRSKKPTKVLRKLLKKCRTVGDLTKFYHDS